MSSQCQVLRPNPKKANQYVLNVKHELTYMQGEAYSSLDEHAQAWLDLILRAAHPIFSKKTRWQTKRQTIQHMVQSRLPRGSAKLPYCIKL